MADLTIRHVELEDRATWLALRRALWPDGSEAEHRAEIESFLGGGDEDTAPWAALLAEDAHGKAVGLAELSVRPCAEGCTTRRVAYLEGWYVVPDARRRGVGRALLAAAEDWGRAERCTEFASDTEPENTTSAAAHLALGFEDAGLVRCFRKEL